ncbi:MAG: hypothetical protein ABIG11_03375 [bacterium]
MLFRGVFHCRTKASAASLVSSVSAAFAGTEDFFSGILAKAAAERKLRDFLENTVKARKSLTDGDGSSFFILISRLENAAAYALQAVTDFEGAAPESRRFAAQAAGFLRRGALETAALLKGGNPDRHAAAVRKSCTEAGKTCVLAFKTLPAENAASLSGMRDEKVFRYLSDCAASLASCAEPALAISEKNEKSEVRSMKYEEKKHTERK